MRRRVLCMETHKGPSHFVLEGAFATVGGSLVAVGRREWVEAQCGGSGAADGQQTGASRAAAAAAASSRPPASGFPDAAGGDEGASSVWVGAKGRGLLGVLGLRDTLRPDAKETVQRLKEMGMRYGGQDDH